MKQCWVLAVVLIVAVTALAQGAEHKVDLQELVRETQKGSPAAGEVSFVWWFPPEFWEATLQQSGTDAAQVKEFVDVLRPYIIVAAVEGTVGPLGGITFETEAKVRAGMKLVDQSGAEHAPLADSKIGADVKNFLAMMKPMLGNMMGEFGKNMHYIVFSAKNAKGEVIADPRQEGRFSIKTGKQTYEWRLPLGSLLPPKTCEKCKASLSGAYKFCPWCGAKLPETEKPK